MANPHYYAKNDQEEELALKLALEASLADAGSWPTPAAAALQHATAATQHAYVLWGQCRRACVAVSSD